MEGWQRSTAQRVNGLKTRGRRGQKTTKNLTSLSSTLGVHSKFQYLAGNRNVKIIMINSMYITSKNMFKNLEMNTVEN